MRDKVTKDRLGSVRQCLAYVLAAHSEVMLHLFLGKGAHDVLQRLLDQLAVSEVLFEGGPEVKTNILFGIQIFHRVPWNESFSHLSPSILELVDGLAVCRAVDCPCLLQTERPACNCLASGNKDGNRVHSLSVFRISGRLWTLRRLSVLFPRYQFERKCDWPRFCRAAD